MRGFCQSRFHLPSRLKRSAAFRHIQGSSSANIGLVLYQYNAPIAAPHRAAVPFHVYFLSAGAVLANRRPVATEDCRSARGAVRTAARNIVIDTVINETNARKQRKGEKEA